MKLKVDSKFQPCLVDDGDELYQNGIFLFNITKMLGFIQKNSSTFPVEQVSVQEIRSGHKTEFDENTIANANLENPIILGEIAPNRFNVIDGNHRLEKAFRNGVLTISVFKITPKYHMQFLTTEKAYKAYIHYWNEKFKQ